MRKVKSIKIIILFFIAALCLFALFFKPVRTVSASVDDNFYFENISVDIEVRKDKTFAITEVLTVHFKSGNVNTGIIRDIQRVSCTTREIDGEEKKGYDYIADLSDVEVTFDGGKAIVTQSLYNSGEFYSVKMQNPSGYMKADSTHVFTLSYIYGMSDDKVKGFDDFTFDILGYAMNATKNFDAKITFPYGTDLSNVTFRTAIKGDKFAWIPEDDEGWKVKGNVITVNAKDLGNDKGLTVQVILEDGFFDIGFKIKYGYYFAFLALAVVGVGVMLWIVFGFNKKPVAPVEFYSPEGMGVMRFAAIWRAGTKTGDTAALILKWAGDGIIEIKPDGKKHFILTVNIKRGKSNRPSDRISNEKQWFDNPAEEAYFDMLFSGLGGKQFYFSTRQYKKASKINKEQLYKITEKVVNWGNDVPKKVVREQLTFALQTALPFISLVPMLSILGYFCALSGTAVPLFFMPFLAAGTFVATEYRKAPAMIILLVFPASFVGMPYVLSYFLFGFFIYDYCLLYFIAPVIWFLGTFILPPFISCRSKEVESDYGKLLGFKQFLLTAELPRIQILFDENPEFFADILPYCLIMGISDKVARRFKGLNIPVPRYFEDDIDMRVMYRGWRHHSHYGRPMSSGNWSSGGGSGGGGGHGGSSGGGGGGGGSRGC